MVNETGTIMYTNQLCSVKWDNEQSNYFKISNGVEQSGVSFSIAIHHCTPPPLTTLPVALFCIGINLLHFICTGCAKKKKDILNIYVKSQIIYIFF